MSLDRLDHRKVALVPGVLALLPEYAGIIDPVADLRAACLSAVAWLGSEVTVLADDQGARVAGHLLDTSSRTGSVASYLVVGNGTARRGEKAPGHLDERAFAYDAALHAWLCGHGALPDPALGRALLAATTGFEQLAGLVPGWGEPVVDYDADPFGVQYWVMRWTLPSEEVG